MSNGKVRIGVAKIAENAGLHGGEGSVNGFFERWRVILGNNQALPKSFRTREEAIAFGKNLDIALARGDSPRDALAFAEKPPTRASKAEDATAAIEVARLRVEEARNRPKGRAQAEAIVRGELEAAGVEPKMWTPHTPLDAGPAGFITTSNPWLTGVADRLTKRMQRNTGVTLRTGQIDERPSLAISAASKPAAIESATKDVQRVLDQIGVRLDAAKDAGLRVNGNEFVFVKTTRAGKLDRGAIMKRAHDQAKMLEKSGLGDQATVADLMDLIFNVVTPKETAAGHVLPKGTYYAVPKAFHDRLLADARKEAQQRGTIPVLRKAARTTTSLMINTLPRTIINNAGGVAMSGMGGAGLIAHGRYLRNPEARALVPKELVGRGTSGSQTRSVAAKEGSIWLRPYRSHTNRMRSYNVAVEDMPRGALAVNNLLKEAKQVQYGSKIKAAMRRVDKETYNIAKGLYDTHPDRYARAIDKTVDWVGDLGRISRLDPGMQIAAPFWRWNMHILKSTLYSMPVKYPKRAVLLQAMGEVGREYQREHGIWPSWIQGALDLGDEIPLLGGVKDTVTTTLPTQGWWPYATQTGVVTSNFDNAGYDPVGALQNLGPVATLPPVLAGVNIQKLERFKDEKSQPIEFGSPEYRKLVLSQVLGELPSPYSRSGQATTSLPWDPTYKDNGLPRRGNSPLELAMRAFGLGTTPVVTGGPDLKMQGVKAFKRAKTSFSKMPLDVKQEMAKGWRQNDDGSYSTIIDLGHGH
jgi:hypothetical protein